MTELKPCPFCGGEAEIELVNDGFIRTYRVYHCCKGNYFYNVKIETNIAGSPEQAAELWNTRAESEDKA